MRTLETDLQAFRAFLAAESLTIFSEQSIDYGYQITVIDSMARVPINFFKTGRILVQGKDSSLKAKLSEWANIQQNGAKQAQAGTADTAPPSQINRSSRYIVSPAKFQQIRNEVIDTLNATVSYRPSSQEAEVYRADIQRDNARVMVTQFQTGTLFVQGRTSTLFDEICETLDQRLAQSFADRAARYLPEETVTTTRQYLESAAAENDAWTWVRQALGQEVFGFLWTHDQQTFVSGAGIFLALQETGRQLAEFSPVVMPFGKAFEGFFTKLAIHLHVVTEEAIQQSSESIKPGPWLYAIRERLPDARRYGFVVDSLSSAWASRNKAVHADPKMPMPIRSLDEARQEITSILRGITKAHDVFVTQGITLREEAPTKPVTTADKQDARHMPADKQDVKPAPAGRGNRFDRIDIERLASRLQADGYLVIRQQPDQNTIWEVRTDDLQIFCSAKNSGRVTIQGAKAQAFIGTYTEFLKPREERAQPRVDGDELFPEVTPPPVNGWIGVDESGKGDVFGPLVVAGVYVTPEQADRLIRLGIRDSKTLTDTAIAKLSVQIQAICTQHKIVVIEPSDYNRLYEHIKNLNHLLAQQHADVISELHATTSAARAISDQFGNERLIQEALVERNCAIELEQRHHAEDDIAVAAASILARAAFVVWLEQQSKRLGIPLPPGVASIAIESGRRILATHGRTTLFSLTKLHFRTVKDMLTS